MHLPDAPYGELHWCDLKYTPLYTFPLLPRFFDFMQRGLGEAQTLGESFYSSVLYICRITAYVSSLTWENMIFAHNRLNGGKVEGVAYNFSFSVSSTCFMHIRDNPLFGWSEITCPFPKWSMIHSLGIFESWDL